MARWVFVGLCFAVIAGEGSALSPNKAISQYLRNAWGAEEGFPGGPVYAFAQTPDGYLWIGAEKGLVRYDGLAFRLFQNADPQPYPLGPVMGLAVDAEGALWIRLQGSRFLRYRNGIFEDVLRHLKLPERNITAMCAGQDGDIVFSGLANGIVRYSKGKFVTLASREQLPRLVISVAETPDESVWVGTRDASVFQLIDGKILSIRQGLPDIKIDALLGVAPHELWIGTDTGVVRWDGAKLSRIGGPRALAQSQAPEIIKDRDQNIWVGSSMGLIRIDAKGVATADGGDGHQNDGVMALFEDREGDLWVGTARGIERLRDSVFTTYSRLPGLSSEIGGPIYADAEGRTWFGPRQGGLYWMKEHDFGRVKDAGLERDVVYSIDGHGNELWIGRQRGGLTRLSLNGSSSTATTFTHTQGLAQDSVYAVHRSRDGTVWAGTLSGGISRFSNGKFQTFTIANGLPSNAISCILEGADGTMWVGTPNGLTVFSKGEWRSYTSLEGLPPGNVSSLLEDSTGLLWIGTTNGVALLQSGHIRIPTKIPPALRQQITAIVEDETGSLWFAAADHIVQVNREQLSHDALAGDNVREYGLADGLLSLEIIKRYRSALLDSSGRVWFSTTEGLSFVDPKPITFRSAPALVQIEAIMADGRTYQPEPNLRISAPHQRITLTYTSLSLAVPTRIRFRYQLEGFDRGWSEPTDQRQVAYTNLDPGTYRFRVISSNSEGVWNSSQPVVNFVVEPVFWRTFGFQFVSALVLVLLVFGLVRLRVSALKKQLNVRFEERLAERTRIAQELHDTLLQGFLSASMQLHVAHEALPPDSRAKPIVARVLDLMAKVTEEGRNTVRGLRSAPRGLPDLEQAFSRVREEFPVSYQTEFRVIVEGTPRPLRPLIRDEVYLIGHEALSNAFRHSRASDIEVELEYAASHLRVLVRDNGAGIAPHVLDSGREGHWGLSGMKERTDKIGGKLRVLSHTAAGTEVELSVPGQIAFEFRLGPKQHSWLSGLF